MIYKNLIWIYQSVRFVHAVPLFKERFFVRLRTDAFIRLGTSQSYA